jgi:hypothetical protein
VDIAIAFKLFEGESAIAFGLGKLNGDYMAMQLKLSLGSLNSQVVNIPQVFTLLR